MSKVMSFGLHYSALAVAFIQITPFIGRKITDQKCASQVSHLCDESLI